MSDSILWFDYETTGIDPACDRPLQFAAVRTDRDLKTVDDPIEFLVDVAEDVIVHPDACLVTGLTPQRIGSRGGTELEFAQKVLAAMSVPGTCSAGFNSLRFDDEVTRFMAWRNLLPVYEREYRGGNSRWDLIDPLRAAYALRPEGIVWPRDSRDLPSFKLERLAEANGIEHKAHDALGDVWATIGMAARLRAGQPRLYAHLFEHRTTARATALFEGCEGRPFVHTNGRLQRKYGCTSVLQWVADHTTNRREKLCVDLRDDPQPLLDEPLEELQRRMSTPRGRLSVNTPPVGLRGVKLNQAPVLAPLGVLDEGEAWGRLGLEPDVIEQRAAWVAAHRDAVGEVARQLLEREFEDVERDPEEDLYGGFLSDADAGRCRRVHSVEPQEWATLEQQFEDARLGPLLFRMRARYAPETLSEEERERWAAHCHARWHEESGSRRPSADGLLGRIAALRVERAEDAQALEILDEVEEFTRTAAAKW